MTVAAALDAETIFRSTGTSGEPCTPIPLSVRCAVYMTSAVLAGRGHPKHLTCLDAWCLQGSLVKEHKAVTKSTSVPALAWRKTN